jgi:hypothetical protein
MEVHDTLTFVIQCKDSENKWTELVLWTEPTDSNALATIKALGPTKQRNMTHGVCGDFGVLSQDENLSRADSQRILERAFVFYDLEQELDVFAESVLEFAHQQHPSGPFYTFSIAKALSFVNMLRTVKQATCCVLTPSKSLSRFGATTIKKWKTDAEECKKIFLTHVPIVGVMELIVQFASMLPADLRFGISDWPRTRTSKTRSKLAEYRKQKKDISNLINHLYHVRENVRDCAH